MNVFELQPGMKQAGSANNRNVKVKAISSCTIKKMSAMRSLLLLCLLKTGVALDLIAPSSHQAFLGANVSIPCSFTIKNPPIVSESLKITWSFQGKEILNVRNSVAILAEPRVSYRGKVEDGIADLIISNVTVTDGGIYKCSVSYNAVQREKEIRLDIQARPLINITNKIVVTNKESVLRATISGFYPVDIDIKWLRDGEKLNHVTGKPQKNPDGTYSVNSSVQIIATSEDRERLYSCRVQHKSLSQPLQEDFQLVYGAVPSVHIISGIFKLYTEQALICSASEFYPEAIAVYWLLNGTRVKNTKTQKINSSETRSIYEFLPTEKNWGMELACVVEHKTLSTPHVETLLVQGQDFTAIYKGLIVSFAICLVLLLAALIIVLLFLKQRKKRLPKVRGIARSGGGIFSLDVDHFYPKDITISWEVVQPPSSARAHPMPSTMIYHQNPDGTYKATSTCESLRGSVEENKPYMVQAVVTHKKLRRPAYRAFASHDQSNTDFHSPPEVGIIQRPKMFFQKPVQLQCAISDFYPAHLTVNWFTIILGVEAEIQTNSGKYKIIESQPTQQQDKTFSYTACLELIPTLEDLGTKIICRVDHPSLEQPKERTTGPLEVLVKPVPQPIQLAINDTGDMVASIKICNFYPEELTLFWTYGNTQNKSQSQQTIDKNPEGTFNVSSHCTIPGDLFEDSKFNVKVTWTHSSMGGPESREISTADPDFPWHPRITNITPLILQAHKETTITCTIVGYFSTKLKVTWSEKKKNGRTATQTTSIEHIKMADNSYSCSPTYSFTPESVTEDMEIICSVEHPSLQQPITRSTGPPRVKVTPLMRKDGLKLTPRDPNTVLCSLGLETFYPENINISWTYGKNSIISLPSTKKIIRTNDEKTFDAISECNVPWTYFGSTVRVTWTHESLPKPQSRVLHPTDFPWRPVIEEIEASVLRVNIKATLQYKISHYFPDDLKVSWYSRKHGRLLLLTTPSYTPDMSTVRKQSDHTYSCTASLRFTPSLIQDEGSVIVCKVEHPSLENPIERSTGPLQLCISPKFQDPIEWTLKDEDEALLSLYLQEFYPKRIDIQWKCSCGQSLTSNNEYKENKDTTFNVISKCSVPKNHLEHRVQVTWNHVSMTDPESREVSIKDPDFPWRPEVEEISNEMLSQKKPTLWYSISKYFPNDLTVNWFVKEPQSQEYIEVNQIMNQQKSILITWRKASRGYKTITSQPLFSDSGYSSTTSLELTPPLSSYQGMTLMCRMQHPSLKNPIEKVMEPLLIPRAPVLKEPIKISLCEPGEVLCSIRLEKLFPETITFTWTFGGKKSSGQPNEMLLKDDLENTFSAISEFRISLKSLKFPVRVSWEHKSKEEPNFAQLESSGYPWVPVLGDIEHPPLIVNMECTLQCQISGYIQGALIVSWHKKKDGKVTPLANDRRYKIPELQHQRQPDNTSRCTARMLFTPTLEDEGSLFICRAELHQQKHVIEKTTRPIQMLVSPQVIEPVKFSLCDSGEVRCSLTLKRFYPEPITITWKHGDKMEIQSESKSSKCEDGDTFDVTSDCTLPQSIQFPVYVIWRHQYMTQQIVLRETDLPWRPYCDTLNTDIDTHNTRCDIQCKIYGYFPARMEVSWYKKKKGAGSFVLVDGNKYNKVISEHKRQPNNTYNCTASLQFTPNLQEDQGLEFMCKVKHPTMEEPIEQRTGALLIEEARAGKSPDPTENTSGQ